MALTIDQLDIKVTSDVTNAAASIERLTASLTGLKAATKGGIGLTTASNQINKLNTSLGNLNSRKLNELAKGMERVKKANVGKLGFGSNKGGRGGWANSGLNTAFTKIRAQISMTLLAVQQVGNVVSTWIKEASSYIENLNLFSVAMGNFSEEALEFANIASETLGLDPSIWIRNQGVFQTLLTGFGAVEDRAYKMSKNLTQLGYDISSFFNITVEESMQKLQSGISGELEPLRRLGYDLSQAKLEATALALGIDKSVNSMTQAEKAELRYYAIMTQVTTAQGDMARTLNAPANQLRILSAQATQAARALGNLLIPALNAVLPYLIAFLQTVRWIAAEFANLFGVEIPALDGDIWQNATSAIEGTTDAVKDLKKATLGFDELNIIGDTAAAGNGSLSGAGFDFELPEYDFLAGAVEGRFKEIFDSWKAKLEPALEWTKNNFDLIKNIAIAIGVAIAGWKLIDVAVKLADLVGGFDNLAIIAAAASVAIAGVDQVLNGIDWQNFAILIGGVAVATAFLGLKFGTTGAAIGLLVGGLVLAFLAIREWVKTGKLGEETSVQLAVGIMGIGVALSLLTGSWIPAAVAAVGSAVAVIVGMWDTIEYEFKRVWNNIITFFENGINGIIGAVNNITKVFGLEIPTVSLGWAKAELSVPENYRYNVYTDDKGYVKRNLKPKYDTHSTVDDAYGFDPTPTNYIYNAQEFTRNLYMGNGETTSQGRAESALLNRWNSDLDSNSTIPEINLYIDGKELNTRLEQVKKDAGSPLAPGGVLW